MKKFWTPQMAGGLVAAGVFGGVALGVAWATDGLGISTTILASGALAEMNVHQESPIHGVKLKTRNASDVYVVRNVVAPGGHTGWHSHPGPSIITVKSGVATAYDGDDPHRTPQVFSAGTSFVDDGQHAHIIRNEGSVPLELVAFQVLPAGAPRRINEPQPPHYDF